MSTFKEDLIAYALKDAPPLMRLGSVTQLYEQGPDGEVIWGAVEREFVALPGALSAIEEAEAEDLSRERAKREAEELAAFASAPCTKSKGGRL